jgi:hypothetical protein
MPVIDRIWWRIPRATLALLSTVAVLAVVVVIIGWVERKRNADEEYAVYSAYLSEGQLNDAHDWSVGGPVQLVIEDTTRIGENLRWSALHVLDGCASFGQLHASTRASFLVRNLLHTRILPKFVLPRRATVVLAPKSDIEPRLQGSPEFQKKFPHNMGFIILSGVGFNVSRTQAVFYIDHFCGLCGGGRYVLMEKANGSWQVRDEHYTWIS